MPAHPETARPAPAPAPPAPRSRRVSLVAAIFATAMLVAGCSAFTPQVPKPTPTDFAGIVSELGLVGVGVVDVVSGDPGCPDQRLARTAISFTASGLDQATPTRVYLYAFKDDTVFQELRPVVDLCARSYVTNAADYASVDASPYAFTGPGPWAPKFRAALRTALDKVSVGG